MSPIRIGLVLFPRLTQLDLTAPFEVFAKMPGARTLLLAKTLAPVEAETGLAILPHVTLADCPPLDVLLVPGGPGVNQAMEDADLLAFLRDRAPRTRYVTSVCTGALVLGAAGLLAGRRATSHWSVVDLLPRFGAIPTKGRVVRDGNLFTGGGVTAGLDFALTVVAELAGPAIAQAIQLQIEYAPDPPFAAGSPTLAPPDILATVMARGAPMRTEREAIIARAAEKISLSDVPEGAA